MSSMGIDTLIDSQKQVRDKVTNENSRNLDDLSAQKKPHTQDPSAFVESRSSLDLRAKRGLENS